MLEWTQPQLSDGGWVRRITEESEELGSDVSFANIYLLRNKYHTQICHYKDFLLRRYEGTGTRKGYAFPVGHGDMARVLRELEKDALASGQQMEFTFLTAAQQAELEHYMPGRFCYTGDAGDSDYIYAWHDLASLSGKAYHKKKNHVSRFERTYPQYEFTQMGCGNWEAAGIVADAWYYEHLQQEDESLQKEYQAIREAVDNFGELELEGGLIYVNGTPCAMTIASCIRSGVYDIHFEKAFGECALNGGYAAINQFFARSLSGVQWLNREEDIGLEGLRKAKMSYHPKMMLRKYHAIERR